MESKVQRLELIKARIESSAPREQNISFVRQSFEDIRSELKPLGLVVRQYLEMFDRLDRQGDHWYRTQTTQLVIVALDMVIDSLRRQKSPKVFLCHASEDARRIKKIHDRLLREGLEPWYDKERLDIGVHWKAEITYAITHSDFFAIFLSNTSIKKTGFVNKEIMTAVEEYGRRPFGSHYLLPVRLDDCEVPPIELDSGTSLTDLQWIDLFSKPSNSFDRFVKGIWNSWHKKQHYSADSRL